MSNLNYMPHVIRDHHDHLSAARWHLEQFYKVSDGFTMEGSLAHGQLQAAIAHALTGLLSVLAEGTVHTDDGK